MARYRCGLCRNVFDQPDRKTEWFRSPCVAKGDRIAIMRKVPEKKMNIRRDAGEGNHGA